MTYTDVLFEEMPGTGGNLGIITLNRPTVLNSLNHEMVNAIHAQLKTWATADSIKAVVIRAAEGRAFCAGGDLRSMFHKRLNEDPEMAYFFRDEYNLNRYIFHFPKPYIALLDGITMGGGVGISIHGSHRVATEKLLFAMPETGIGFFPDVGGTYFLPRLPGKLGYFLGLTGTRLNSDDCMALGIAQHKVAPVALLPLLDVLARKAYSQDAKASVTQIIKEFEIESQPSTVFNQRDELDACFAAHSMEEILQELHHSIHAICQDAANTLSKKSPTSLKVTLRALQEGRHFDFDTCMRHEYRLVTRFLQGHDFAEGIRAVIIDKDQSPRWVPASLNEVTHQEVEKYFSPMSEELV